MSAAEKVSRRSAFLLVDAQPMFASSSPATLTRIEQNLHRIRQRMPVIHIWFGFGPGTPQVWPIRWAGPRLVFCHLDRPGLVPLILPDAGDLCLKKGYADAFSNRALAPALRSRGIDHVLVGGFRSGACVLATLAGAKEHGLRSSFVPSLSADWHDRQELHPEYVARFRQYPRLS